MADNLITVALAVLFVGAWALWFGWYRTFLADVRRNIATRDRIIVDQRDQLDSYARELAQLKHTN